MSSSDASPPRPTRRNWLQLGLVVVVILIIGLVAGRSASSQPGELEFAATEIAVDSGAEPDTVPPAQPSDAVLPQAAATFTGLVGVAVLGGIALGLMYVARTGRSGAHRSN